jgi:XRE family aerobic/anaerobic benzoate catabolism transcriptional regulator
MKARSEPIVHWLSQNVRTLRRRRAWSLVRLAKESGLSARFVGQVESGRANISVVNLAHIAEALRTSAAELLQPATNASVALLGLRGAGKSTVGPELARRLGIRFVELDRLVEERSGLPLYDVFSVHGEGFYRRMEADSLSGLLASDEPAVLATGGGVVTARETYDRLKRSFVTIWLRARPEDHMDRVIAQGDERPMAARDDAMAELRQILATRAPLYAEADLIVDTSDSSPDEIIDRIQQALARSGHPAG